MPLQIFRTVSKYLKEGHTFELTLWQVIEIENWNIQMRGQKLHLGVEGRKLCLKEKIN